MSLSDRAKAEQDAAEDERAHEAAEARAARYRRERDLARTQLGRTTEALDDANRMLQFHDAVVGADPHPPKWLTPKKPKAGHRATVVAILSDTHFDEVVNPDELGGLNAYDRDIATMRLRRWAENLAMLSRDYLSGVTYDGAVVMLGGDIFTGNLHDLAETNEDTLFGSLLYWSEQLAAALGLVLEEFGRLHVPVVVGNHGRLTRKPRTKQRARDNMDWLLGHMLARHFAGDDRVTFDIPENTDVLVKVYGTTHLLTHGDQVSGGGGIGGIWPPLMRMKARKNESYSVQGKPFDVMVCGHWHQLITAPDQGLIVNGSLKSVDEYAWVSGFRPERAQQGLWIVTPENGITISAPILVTDRKREGW